ncbi:RAMP superfamily CRISPR-associated protein [Methylococcus sp. ANG]|uniref:RAMP superfamily CRISPR-associated protein n=1 Tax=Methylococcus sp. ANG TaxID=3231903 RepID=UPI0034583F46
MSPTKTLSYRVQFLTPAFLGNAEQSGQWRTPPFKALLRQWWRVAYAADHGFRVDIADMRHEEGKLFGHAWLDDDRDERGQKVSARKSLVRMRLEHPNDDHEKAWLVGTQTGVAPLSNGLETSYAWFGLIKRGAGQPDRTAIKAADSNEGPTIETTRRLYIAVPDEYAPKILEIMRLINAFGLLGSRSRGGWGALRVEDLEQMRREEISRYARPLDKCLGHDWPMSLATDDDGLCVWQSNLSFNAWHEAMRVVAIERRRVRSELKGISGRDLRPALGFATPGRMPSPLRWKIIPSENGKLGIRVFALPHKLPAESGKSMQADLLRRAWQVVCNTLDQSPHVTR